MAQTIYERAAIDLVPDGKHEDAFPSATLKVFLRLLNDADPDHTWTPGTGYWPAVRAELQSYLGRSAALNPINELIGLIETRKDFVA